VAARIEFRSGNRIGCCVGLSCPRQEGVERDLARTVEDSMATIATGLKFGSSASRLLAGHGAAKAIRYRRDAAIYTRSISPAAIGKGGRRIARDRTYDRWRGRGLITAKLDG
jgi:hypothetical protein